MQEHARTIIKRKECVLRNAKEHAFECQPIVFGSDSFLMKGLRLTRENSQGATGYASHCHHGKDIGYRHKQSCYSPCWALGHICTCSRRPHLCLKDPSTVARGMTNKYKYRQYWALKDFKSLQICRQSSDRNDTTRNRMPAQDACGFSNGHVGLCLHLGIIPNILLDWQHGACEKWCLPTMGWHCYDS